jgi:UDP-N-acetylglucosamine 2-epimerase (non-hydrolysing)
MNKASQKKVAIIFGTRPEAIKLAPVIARLRGEKEIRTTVCVFRQHKGMLDQTIKTLGIEPDLTLPISLSDRDLFSLRGNIIKKGYNAVGSAIGLLRYVRFLKRERPNLLIVQGDTSTAYLGAFIAAHYKIPIAHVEAGLRTGNKYAPFPEEINRTLIARLADIHFAPTKEAKKNLIKEGVPEEAVHVVGNTAIDTLLAVSKPTEKEKSGKMILVTAHRRESFGRGLQEICTALKEIVSKHKDVKIVYPVHDNPNVQSVVYKNLEGVPNIHLTTPAPYHEMVQLMNNAHFILTDSGGIQEEAPSLGKPVLVMREETERTEGIKAGVSKLVGTKKESILEAVSNLLENEKSYQGMIKDQNPYGDGKASEYIVSRILMFLRNQKYE